MAGEIKLKVDPKAIQQEKYENRQKLSTPIVTGEDTDGRTLSLRKEGEPIQMITPAAAESLPMQVVEAQQSKKALKKRKDDVDINKRQRKHPKRVLTEAEKNYWRVLLASFSIIFGLLIVALGVTVGTVSFFLITRVIENPAHGFTLHNAADQIRNAGSLSEKYEIMVRTYNEVRDGDIALVTDDDSGESKYKKVFRGVGAKVNRKHSAEENMTEN